MGSLLHHHLLPYPQSHILSSDRTNDSLQLWRLRKPPSATKLASNLSIFNNGNDHKALTLLSMKPHDPQLWGCSRARSSGAAERIVPTLDPTPDIIEDEELDVIVIGSGMGGLVASTELAVRGASVLLLEKYIIPGGSSGFYRRCGYTFDVGSSVMFGCGDKVQSLHYCLSSP